MFPYALQRCSLRNLQLNEENSSTSNCNSLGLWSILFVITQFRPDLQKSLYENISQILYSFVQFLYLYADDLILMAESEESPRDKIVKWKSGLEAKGLKMNTGKTKVMFSCSMKDKVEEKGKWPCGVYKKGVGNNSILCHGCKKWIHKPCSGVKGSLCYASQSFICRCCKVDRPITDGLNTDLHLNIGNWGIAGKCR